MKPNPTIFREYDIRGIADRDLPDEFAENLGYAYASYFKKTGGRAAAGRARPLISVGRDCRLSGERLTSALVRGLRKAGFDVVTLGVVPTPLTYFSVFHLGLDGGIMVTGSHNPSEYNGFKIGIGKSTLHGSEIQELRKIIEAQSDLSSLKEAGSLSQKNVVPAYIEDVLSKSKTVVRKKIVVDAGNGTAGPVAPELLRRMGAEVIPLFCEMDGRFPNHHPDPTVPSNLKHLIEAVRKEKADFGLAFDGDSDRIGMVDENGRVIYGDELMVLLSRDVLKDRPGATIISEVKSSYRLYQDIKRRGGNGIMWKTGHSLIKSKMKETGAMLAGEMSGHIFFADRYYGYDDAIYAAARIYEIASGHSAPFSTLLSDLEPVQATPEIRVDCADEVKFEVVDGVRRLLEKDYDLNTIDGVRVDFSDGWGLVRASNTQPVLVLRFEATSSKRLQEIRELLENAVEKSRADR